MPNSIPQVTLYRVVGHPQETQESCILTVAYFWKKHMCETPFK